MISTTRHMKQHIIILILCASVLCTCLARQEVNSYVIDQTYRSENTIELSCLRDSTPIQDAFYFNNGTRIDNRNSNFMRVQGRLKFEITRELEGVYTCGNGSPMSNSLSLTAYPDSTFILDPPITYALVGEQVQLNCAIVPGKLIQYYYVTWEVDGRTLFRTRPNVSPHQLNDNYGLSTSSLSLIINNVQLKDTSSEYHCVLTVVDPITGLDRPYNNLQDVDIGLVVLANPEMVVAPQTYTTVEGENALFRCVAQGYPAPVISWRHKNVTLSAEDNPSADYIITPDSRQDGNLMITDSELRILSVKTVMSGEVECIVTASPPKDSGRTLTSIQASASLTVFGMFAGIDVEITRQLDVLFAINLAIAYRQEVWLVLVYTNVDDPAEAPYNKTSSMPYANRTMIRHIEFASQIPFEHFQVQVGLTFDGVDGPLISVPGKFDKNEPTACERRIEIGLYVAIGVLAALLVISIIAIIIAFIDRWRLRRKVEDHHEEITDVVEENSDSVTTSINQHMDKKFAEMNKLLQQLLTVRQQMETNATNCLQGDGEAYEMEPMKELKEFDQACATFTSKPCLMALENPCKRDQVKGSVGDTMKELLLMNEQ